MRVESITAKQFDRRVLWQVHIDCYEYELRVGVGILVGLMYHLADCTLIQS